MTSAELLLPEPAAVRQPLAKARSGHHAKTHHLQLVGSEAEQPKGLEAIFSQFDHSVCLHPGRRGGRFQLPEGGCVVVPEGAFGRPTDALEVAAVQPAELAGFCPDLAELESVVSPVYVLATSRGRLPCQLLLTLPLLKRPEPPLSRLRLMHRAEAKDGEVDISEGDSGEWRELPVAQPSAEDDTFVTVEVETTGVYLALLSPVKEPVRVTPEGGIMRLQLDPLASLRVPKNAFTEPGRIDFSIIPFSPDRMSLVRKLHRSETLDIASLSPMYSLDYDGPPCRRGLTVKLPLPDWMCGAERREILDRLAIMSRQRPETAWAALDAKKASVRLTRKSISFECRQPARFCLLEAASPQWLPRAALGFPRCAEMNAAEPGELLLFAAFERRRWALGARLAPISEGDQQPQQPRFDIDATSAGVEWRRLEKNQPRQSEVQEVMRQLRRRRRERDTSAAAAAAEAALEEARNRRVEVELRDGATVTLQMSGDFRLRHLGESRAREEVCVQFHRRFADRMALFEIVPTARTATITSDFYDYLLELAADSGEALDNDEKLVDLAGRETLTFKGVITVLSGSGEQLSNHEFTIGFRDLKAYLDLKPPPAPEEPSDGEAAVAATQTTQNAKPAEQRPAWYRYYPRLLDLRIYRLKPEEAKQESLQRLTAPRRTARSPIHGRESRALSRASLQHLAGRLSGSEAADLAGQLGLPDSAISVLSFESAPLRYPPAAASIPYRLLLYWKRARAADGADAQVESLGDALDGLGRRRLAGLLRRCHAEGRELTAERLAGAEDKQRED
ncbi:hypothetical protein BOX15_Mlig028632g1 [Macrostomum lignano]|uniref:Death domain-containing protein n=1 Tax=Macrostomum lignano TaxID=282301 RepID=A0A267EFA4_9PLAT|nr:hypothetical protein BOX15_Mlig028632g1 [Macrostomum lignano]